MAYLQFWSAGTELDWISSLFLFNFLSCVFAIVCAHIIHRLLPAQTRCFPILRFLIRTPYFCLIFHMCVYIHTHVLSWCLCILRSDFASIFTFVLLQDVGTLRKLRGQFLAPSNTLHLLLSNSTVLPDIGFFKLP